MSKKKSKKMYGQFPSETFVDSDGNLKRVCAFCGEAKDIQDFPKNGFNEDGTVAYRKDCKRCYNIRRRENATKKKHSDFLGSMKRRGEEVIDYTHQQWKETVIFFGGTCAYCGKTMHKGERLTKDHLLPVSEGGATTQDNIIPACSRCNSSKGKEEWRTWFMKQPFFSQERMNKIFQWRSIINACERE